ncbi:MAG: DUF1883 domain-containing protein [Microbacterium sp.]|uniref:DUF1883 domain-containing protein n=1 Tax=Microbacterium sp. TaxID=51671 RepID=UPI001DBEE2E0|nr:DUF1883 domain-containing protein [Microbacterium sp.]
MVGGLKFQRYDLGFLPQGATVEVTLSTGANVRLMTISDYENFRNRRAHRYQGGLARRSPLSLTVPATGHWVITIDLDGLAATTVTSRVRVQRPE